MLAVVDGSSEGPTWLERVRHIEDVLPQRSVGPAHLEVCKHPSRAFDSQHRHLLKARFFELRLKIVRSMKVALTRDA
jgi:hypothetical protein